jgi:hypothetical protein
MNLNIIERSAANDYRDFVVTSGIVTRNIARGAIKITDVIQ